MLTKLTSWIDLSAAMGMESRNSPYVATHFQVTFG